MAEQASFQIVKNTTTDNIVNLGNFGNGLFIVKYISQPEGDESVFAVSVTNGEASDVGPNGILIGGLNNQPQASFYKEGEDWIFNNHDVFTGNPYSYEVYSW